MNHILSLRIFNVWCQNNYTSYSFTLYDDGSTGDYQVNFHTSLLGTQTQGGMYVVQNARVRMMSGLIWYRNNYVINN